MVTRRMPYAQPERVVEKRGGHGQRPHPLRSGGVIRAVAFGKVRPSEYGTPARGRSTTILGERDSRDTTASVSRARSKDRM